MNTQSKRSSQSQQHCFHPAEVRLAFVLSSVFLICILGSMTFLSPGLAQDLKARTSLKLEVLIPGRAIMMLGDSEQSDESALTLDTVFDLTCAVLSHLPAHCTNLYEGAFLDTQGRPYPPVELDAKGEITGFGHFPQFFDAPGKSLKFFISSPDWELQVDVLSESEALTADHLAVSLNDRWTCLAYHPDWQSSDTYCPRSHDASQQSLSLVSTTDSDGAWQALNLAVRLRLDGSEAAGSFESVLRYTLVSF